MVLSERALILVVEDEDDVREFAVKVLSDTGHTVMQAANGGIALAILDQDLPVDLLFTDIVMASEPDGIELAEWARRLRPDIKILYTTGFMSALRFDDRSFRFHDRSFHGGMLAKPYRPKQLVSVVRQLLSADVAAH